MANLDGPGALLQSKTEAIAQYLNAHTVSDDLSAKTLAYLKQSWSMDKGIGTKQFYELLPTGLKSTFWKQIRAHYLRNAKLLHSSRLQEKVLSALTQESSSGWWWRDNDANDIVLHTCSTVATYCACTCNSVNACELRLSLLGLLDGVQKNA